MRKKLILFIYMIILSTYMIAGCVPKIKDSNKPSKESLKIVTSFYPIYLHVINITKDIPGIDVINMTQPQTGCLHDYQLTPDDLKTLGGADIFVINGGGMESFMDKVLSQLSEIQIIDASKDIDLLEEHDSGHNHEDEEHDSGHNHESEEHDSGHSHEVNPHVWVSVSGAIEQVSQIAKELAHLDKDHEKEYEKNASDYISDLEDLSKEMHEVLDNIPNKNIVTFHEAFPYFAEEFGLNIVGTIVSESGSEPSAKELTQIIQDIKKYDVKAVFAEPQYASKAADVISKEANVKLYTLDPIVTGEANQSQKDEYITKMKENLKTLEEALR